MKKTKCFINEVHLDFQKKLFTSNRITCSDVVADVAREIYTTTKSKIELKEYFFMIMLNQHNEVIGYIKLGEGGITETAVDSRLAFATALKCLASGIILIHNHPSSNLTPSINDRLITQRFNEIGKLLNIKVVDHIILTASSYCSFLDEGFIKS
jgi:DNA repair protein RadC